MVAEYVKITGVVLAYWSISITMVFANKHLLGDRNSAGDVSLFVAWIQCIVCVLVVVCKNVGRGLIRGDWTRLRIRDNGPVVRPILTMTCTYVGMLTFNNLCLKNVGIAFYQVARSLTLIFVVIFSVLLLKKNVSLKIVTCCVIVAGGFVLGVDQESLAGTISVSGVAFGIVTSLFVSLNGILTKTALDYVERDSVKLTFYNNINAVVLFFPFVLATGQFKTVATIAMYHTPEFWLFLVASGMLSFMIAWISAVQIDITSPVTHHISANAKAVLQTLIAVMYNGEHKSFLWWVSILMVVGGALSYALTRIREDSTDKKKILPLNGVATNSITNFLDVPNSVEMEPNVAVKGRERSNTA